MNAKVLQGRHPVQQLSAAAHDERRVAVMPGDACARRMREPGSRQGEGGCGVRDQRRDSGRPGHAKSPDGPARGKRCARCVNHPCATAPGGFGGQSHSTGYDGGIRTCKRTRGAVVDWRHSTNSRHFACFFFFSRFDKP
ncbi:hypothetical protein FCJ57_30475 [Burkholderia diffusa]|nr:hypothetical protein [Burkholderia diffusa]